MQFSNHFESLLEEAIVLRFIINPLKANKPSANNFESEFALSSEEKTQYPNRLSVWDKTLTPVRLAKSFIRNPDRDVVVELEVSKVRALSDIESNDSLGLDVKWDHLDDCIDKVSGFKLQGAIPGCEGHCGIFGLNPVDKLVRKRIRAALADLATRSVIYPI